MEQANFAHQTLKDTQTTVIAMKDGMKAMKRDFKKINIDDIDVSVGRKENVKSSRAKRCFFQDVQDELADMLDQADEVQEALGRNYNTPELDDDELAAELDALGNFPG